MSLVPTFLPPPTNTVDPTLVSTRLSDGEQATMSKLAKRITDSQRGLDLSDAFYDGLQEMESLGISLPPELGGLRTVLAWPQLSVDPLHHRGVIEGYRYPGTESADSEMWEIHQRNNLDSEMPLGHLDCLIHGRSHIVVGTDTDTDVPLVTIESAKNLAYVWNQRRRMVTAALQMFVDEDTGDRASTLYLPDETIELEHDGRRWLIADRDDHRLGFVPVFPMPNRARIHDRTGRSEISPVVRSLTQAACRAMLRMEIGAEFFSTPQRYVVGAAVQDFEDEHGDVKSAWETYIGRWLLLGNADEDEKPLQVGQFAPGDPGAHTRVLDFYAERLAEATGLPLTYLGKSTDNPASADAIRMSTDRLIQRAKLQQLAVEDASENAMRAAMAFKQGKVPDRSQMIETIWRSPEIPTPAQTTDAIVKQTQSGHLAAGSDVALEALGYTPLQRARITRELKKADSASALDSVIARVAARGQGADPAAAAGQPPQPTQIAPIESADTRRRHDIPNAS